VWIVVGSKILLTEPAQDGHVHQALLRRDTAVPREQVAQDQHVEFRLVVAEYHGGPQVVPLVTLEQAFRVFDLEPHTGVQQHGPFEGARRGPLSQTTVADHVQASRCDGTVCCADDEGGEGGGATGVEVDVVIFGDVADYVEDLGREEDGDRSAYEDVGEDGGETHDVRFGEVGVAVQWEVAVIAEWLRGGKGSRVWFGN